MEGRHLGDVKLQSIHPYIYTVEITPLYHSSLSGSYRRKPPWRLSSADRWRLSMIWNEKADGASRREINPAALYFISLRLAWNGRYCSSISISVYYFSCVMERVGPFIIIQKMIERDLCMYHWYHDSVRLGLVFIFTCHFQKLLVL